MRFAIQILKYTGIYAAIGVVSLAISVLGFLACMRFAGNPVDELFVVLLSGTAFAPFGPPVALLALTALKWGWWRNRAPSVIACALLGAFLGLVPVIAICAVWDRPALDFWTEDGALLYAIFGPASVLFCIAYARVQRRLLKREPRGFAPIMIGDGTRTQ